MAGAAAGSVEPWLEAVVGDSVQMVYARRTTPLRGLLPPVGASLPGTVNLFVAPDGRLYPTSQVADALTVGDVWRGVDIEACLRLGREFAGAVGPECEHCWAVRMCPEGIRSAWAGAAMSAEYLREACDRTRRRLLAAMRVYVRGIARDPALWDRHFAGQPVRVESM